MSSILKALHTGPGELSNLLSCDRGGDGGSAEYWKIPMSWEGILAGGTHNGEGHMKRWGVLLGGVTAHANALEEMALGRGF